MERVAPRSARSVGVVTTVRAAVGLLTRLPVGASRTSRGPRPSPWSGRPSGAWRRWRSSSWPWPASRCWVRSPRSGCSPPCPAACTWTAWPTRPTPSSRPTPMPRNALGRIRSVGPGGAVALLRRPGRRGRRARLRDRVVGSRGGRVGRRRRRCGVALAAGARGRAPPGPGRTRRPRRLVQRRRLGSRRDRRGGHGRAR